MSNGGRPKGLATLVREQTRDGKEIVELMLGIMRGTHTILGYTAEGVPFQREPSHRDRIESAEWLADRGFGKALITSTDVPLGMTEAEREKAVARVLAAGGVVLPPAK